MADSSNQNQEWYKTKWGILFILALWPIFLLAFLTKFIWQRSWSLKTRIIILSLFWGSLLITGRIVTWQSEHSDYICTGPDGKKFKISKEACDKFNQAWKDAPKNYVNQSQPEEKVKKEEAITLSPTRSGPQDEKFNIVVASQIVKKVDGKYRYFFDIRNYDSKPFSGTVTIKLFNQELKNALAGNSFGTQSPIEPSLGDSVYIDAFTGPTNIHGGNGLSRFEYTVTSNDKEVNRGDGIITAEHEDIDAYEF